MKKGLVLGKFMPLHNGHIAMIKFALTKCDKIILLLCAEEHEQIDSFSRMKFLKEVFGHNEHIEIKCMNYKEENLTSSSVSNKNETKKWADALISFLDTNIDTIISSEEYGQFLADFMHIECINYDIERTTVPISATKIRKNPYIHWDMIPEIVQKYYYRKVCIVGTESTGKTVLAKKLTNYFNGKYISEAGRDLTGNVYDCIYEDLSGIAYNHALNIKLNDSFKNKILIIDTDINITKSYSKFLFNKELKYDKCIDSVNQFDLYLFLTNDVPHIQDGTRLTESDRNKLNMYHIRELNSAGIKYKIITGTYYEKYIKAIKLILKNANKF
jgi:HTH-type transcriptional repressor of NAD biosynthesis genes